MNQLGFWHAYIDPRKRKAVCKILVEHGQESSQILGFLNQLFLKSNLVTQRDVEHADVV